MDATTFRTAIQEAGGYLHSMRGRTMVVHLPGEMPGHAVWSEHLADLALLNHLGVRLAVVFAPTGVSQPTASMSEDQLADWTQAVATTQTVLIAALNRALPGIRPRLVVSNAVSARPLGVRNGQHSGYLGNIRSLDTAALQSLLGIDHVVLVPPLAPSLLGGYYALDSQMLAAQLALQLPAQKLIMLTDSLPALDGDSLTFAPADLRQMAESSDLPAAVKSTLMIAANAADGADGKANGVDRVHLLDINTVGVLIAELYTRRGAGALVARNQPERLRPARPDDAPGLLRMIEPLEREGVLVERGRNQLESEIDRFWVLELEDQVIGCCALIAHAEDMELAALAVEPTYRRQGRASKLLAEVEKTALSRGAKRLFVSTTVAEDWFLERGFARGAVADLPIERAALYSHRRNSVILIKPLTDKAGK